MEPRLTELKKLEARADVIKKALKAELADPALSKTFFGAKYAALVSSMGPRDVFRGPSVYAVLGDAMFECCELHAAKLRAALPADKIADCSLSLRVGPRTVTVSALTSQAD
jgi:hypothetical protein